LSTQQIHCRDAHAETLALLESERVREVGGIMHCFTGDAAQPKPLCQDLLLGT
jgi:TatD DNase family protein